MFFYSPRNFKKTEFNM